LASSPSNTSSLALGAAEVTLGAAAPQGTVDLITPHLFNVDKETN